MESLVGQNQYGDFVYLAIGLKKPGRLTGLR
jgi:hypothetical protein